MTKITPENIEELGPNEIFVFGANESGVHGAGAAKVAHREFGAIWGMGFGASGSTFAIPTKDWKIKELELEEINHYVQRFIAFAKDNKDYQFLVTQIGCGLAGFVAEEIAPMFRECINIDNISLPQKFIDVINNPMSWKCIIITTKKEKYDKIN